MNNPSYLPGGHSSRDTHNGNAAGEINDHVLTLHADVLDDLERSRIACENRLRQFTRHALGEDGELVDKPDKDGELRGFGLTLDHPDVARLAGIVDALAKLEHDATLNLQRRMRAHPLGAWIKTQPGIGEKQAARLLAAIGDPYWNTLHDRPRTVSELWAYCGLHVLPAGQTSAAAPSRFAGGEPQICDPDHAWPGTQRSNVGVAARRRKGERANWSATAKMRAYLIAKSCMKQRSSPFRADYEDRRAYTAVTHPEWTAGHSHNDALRITAKEVLKQLWREARRIHEVEECAA